MAKHLRRTPTAIRVGRAITVPVVLAGALAVSAPAFAGKPTPGGGSGTTGGASCSVSPSAVAYNTDYTLTVRGLAAGAIVNVLVNDAGGTQTWNLQADSSGTTAVVGHAYYRGHTSVAVTKSARKGSTTVASCGFDVA
jgi:hypothetical protein